MQPLTAAPRQDLTEAQVFGVLTANDYTIQAGCERLSPTNVVLEDVSVDMVEGGSIEWDNRNPIHGSCRLSFQRTFQWGRDRVRPYVDMTSAGVTARFYLGVYVLDKPDENRAETPITYTVTGYDLLSLLQSGPADTYVVAAGELYFDAAQAVITESGIGAQLLLDGDLSDLEVPATRVWALHEPAPTYLRILTDLLAEIGYVTPWVDPEGNIRSRPYVNPILRAPEWTLDLRDVATNIVGEDRTITIATSDVANWWRFVMANAEVLPVEGDGIYTPAQNDGEGPNSISALGRTVRKVMYLQAADQDALVAQGDRIVAADKASVRTITLVVGSLPIMGFDDVFTFIDLDGIAEKLAAVSWSFNLDGTPGRLQLGGAPPTPLDSVETQMKATVTDDAPLTVVVDGATVASFANALDGNTYLLGDRVTVTVRNPVPPLVQGVES